MSSSGKNPSPGHTQSHQHLLLRVSKAKKRTLEYFAEGIYLERASSRTLTDMQHQACADRISLARNFLGTGDKLMRTRPPEYRSAISRYYYSMYHAMRAVAYFNEGGDDKESHSALPRAVPSDFPNSAIWQNELKDARSRRNEADYDPYPLVSKEWLDVARHLQNASPALLVLAQSYLKQKGCSHI